MRCRRIDQLVKNGTYKPAHGIGDTGDPEEQDSRHSDQTQQDVNESWASCLDPELFHSQSVVPGELVLSHEWSDVVLTDDGAEGPKETSGIPTWLPLDLEPVTGFSDAEPSQNGESSRCVRLLLPVSGLTTAKAPAGGADSFAPTPSVVCDQDQDHCRASVSSAVVPTAHGVIPRTEPCSLESLLLPL